MARACTGSPRPPRRRPWRRRVPRAYPSAAPRARGSHRSAPARRCGCSRRATCVLWRRAEARADRTIPRGTARLCPEWGRRPAVRSKVAPMFDGRIYRAAFVPLLFVLVIAGFSLASRPGPLRPMLAPDAFNGPRAYAGLLTLDTRFPDRLPGSAGDNALAAYVAHALNGSGAPT